MCWVLETMMCWSGRMHCLMLCGIKRSAAISRLDYAVDWRQEEIKQTLEQTGLSQATYVHVLSKRMI